jgi:hypothetical protein
MLIKYEDITSRIDEKPKWYTHEGVPRYCEFSPKETGVYVRFAFLAEIQCQSCLQLFLIGEGYNRENWSALLYGDKENYINDLNKIIEHYDYGDPPRHDCSGGGETMNCINIRFVEVWQKENETGEKELANGMTVTVVTKFGKWVRRTDCEGSPRTDCEKEY